MYGNLDSKKEFEFDEKSKGYYVVRHSRFETLASGQTIEDPGTVHYQYYSPMFWELNVTQPQMRGGVDNITRVSGESMEVLHDPTIEESTKEEPKRGRPKKEETEN